MLSFLTVPLIQWLIFGFLILVTLAVDLGLANRKAHVISIREALLWSAVWILLALLFCVGIHFFRGHNDAILFLTGYLVEKSLSIDNLFVFLVVFSYFRVPEKLHHKVLVWGVLGAVIMRAILIATGISLIQRFAWLMYVLGAFLIFTGIKSAFQHGERGSPATNPIVKWIQRVLPITEGYRGESFFVREKGKLLATPLFLVLLVIELTDVIFALDSIPAILAITIDPFIVYTSNLFAILGLRALYFALAGLMQLFRFLQYGISAILVFVGFEMIVKPWIHFSEITTLGVILFCLVASVVASILIKKENHK